MPKILGRRLQLSSPLGIALLTAVLCLIAVVADAAVDSRLLNNGPSSFVQNLLRPPADEIYFRSVTVVLMGILGLVASRLLAANRRELANRVAAGESLLRADKKLREELVRRTRAEQETRTVSSYLDLHVRRMPIGFITWDLSYCIRSWNETAEKIFGFTSAEAIGRHANDLIVPEDERERVDKTWERLTAGDATAHLTNNNVTKDGRTIVCHWTNTPLKDTEGNIVGVMSMVEDITEFQRQKEALEQYHDNLEKLVEERGRKLEEANEELCKAAARYRTIFDAAGDEVFVVSMDGRFLDVNEATCRRLGYSRDELVGVPVQQFVHPSHRDSVVRRIDHTRVHGTGIFESIHVGKDGTLFPVEIKTSIVDYNGQPAGLAIARDTSERKRALDAIRGKEQLQSYVMEVTKAQEAERKRIAQDLHDGVLQSVCLLSLEVGAMVDRPSRASEDRLEMLKGALDDMAESLRHYCRDLRPEMLDTMGLAPTLSLVCSNHEKRTNIETVFSSSGEERRLPLEVETAFFRIAQESLNNVAKHAGACHTTLSLEFGREAVILSIEDDGSGFKAPASPAQLPASCLGLRGMAERAKLVGATLNIDSVPGRGTWVNVSFFDRTGSHQLPMLKRGVG